MDHDKRNKHHLPTVHAPHPIPDLPRALILELDQLVNIRLNEPGPLLEKLALLYDFVTRVSSEHVAPYTSCRPKCSHCCHIDVHITTFEAEYIAIKTGVPHQPAGPSTMGHRTPCPFLAGSGDCAIYNHRPLVCRLYFVLSRPELCAGDGEVLQYGTETSGFGNQIFRAATLWVRFQNNAVSGLVRDIRDFFPHDRNRVQLHLAGR